MATRLSTIKDIRLKKLQELKKKGINPFPPNFERSHVIGEARNLSGKKVSIAGKIIALREHGKIIFADVSDESGKITARMFPEDWAEELPKPYWEPIFQEVKGLFEDLRKEE